MIIRVSMFLLLSLLLLPVFGQEPPPGDRPELGSDLTRLQRVSDELVRLEQEMYGLQKAFKVRERGFYTADEHDKIESLLFRYLLCRDALWDVVYRYRDSYGELAEPDDQARAFVLCFSAALNLAYYSSTLIKTFDGDPQVVAKLNEGFPRTRIPVGTWDRIFKSVTNVEHLREVRGAWSLYEAELKDAESRLRALIAKDPAYMAESKRIMRFFAAADANISGILEGHSVLFPNLRNRLRHSILTDVFEKTSGVVDDRMKAARAVLFLRVSRLKNPTKGVISFSPKQVSELRQRLRPGDVILTFTAGYMSNVFLPGTFKHGLTFVGTPADRVQAGLKPGLAETLPGPVREAFRRNLVVAKTADGHPADVIEAVAEGVIFSSLEHLLQTHINRLVVLRPRLDAAERAGALATAFSLIDNPYDFGFDFNDGTYQCCTEVIYRSLHQRGAIDLKLTPRMGKPTLSADDILDQHFAGGEKMFDFVLLADSAPQAPRQAALFADASGLGRLRAMMAAD